MTGNLRCCNNIHWGKRISVTVQWTTVDHMTLCPAKLNIIGTAVVNSRDYWGNPKIKAGVLPVYIRCTTLQLTLTVFQSKNLNKYLMFGFQLSWSCNITQNHYHQLGFSHANFTLVDEFVTIVVAAVVEAVVHSGSLAQPQQEATKFIFHQNTKWLIFPGKLPAQSITIMTNIWKLLPHLAYILMTSSFWKIQSYASFAFCMILISIVFCRSTLDTNQQAFINNRLWMRTWLYTTSCAIFKESSIWAFRIDFFP